MNTTLTFRVYSKIDRINVVTAVPRVVHYVVNLHSDRNVDPPSWSSRTIINGQYFKVYVQDNKQAFKLDILCGAKNMYSHESIDHYFKLEGGNLTQISFEEYNQQNKRQVQNMAQIRDIKYRYIWDNLFVFAIHFYETSPNTTKQILAKTLLQDLGRHIIPCGRCRVHLDHFIKTYKIPLEEVVKSRDTLIKFTVDLKNSVNGQKKLPQYTLEETLEYFKNKEQWVEKIDSVGLSLYAAFNQNNINGFFGQFNSQEFTKKIATY